MSDKDVVMETLRQLPETATLEQISEEVAILAAIRKDEAAADAKRVTPHEEVRDKLSATLSTQDTERQQWTAFSLQDLARAYGDDEPEYTLVDLRP